MITFGHPHPMIVISKHRKFGWGWSSPFGEMFAYSSSQAALQDAWRFHQWTLPALIYPEDVNERPTLRLVADIQKAEVNVRISL